MQQCTKCGQQWCRSAVHVISSSGLHIMVLQLCSAGKYIDNSARSVQMCTLFLFVHQIRCCRKESVTVQTTIKKGKLLICNLQLPFLERIFHHAFCLQCLNAYHSYIISDKVVLLYYHLVFKIQLRQSDLAVFGHCYYQTSAYAQPCAWLDSLLWVEVKINPSPITVFSPYTTSIPFFLVL